MSTVRPVEPRAEMSLSDIYYVLFRHKWKILILSISGILAAVALYHFRPPIYQSQAELIINYVPEAKTMLLGNEMIVPGSESEDVIESEIQILTSLDLAEEVVTNLGAAAILAQAGGGDNPLAAAALVRNNLHAEPTTRGGNVLLVTFRHPNPQIVQPILQEVINDYFQKHYEIHSVSGQYDENLSREQADLQMQLEDTEKQLTEVKNNANILSMDDTRNNLGTQISKIQESVLEAEAKLDEYGIATTNSDTSPSPKPDATADQTPIPVNDVQAYNDVTARLKYLQQKQQSYIDQGFTSENVLVKDLAQQIADAEQKSADLEKKYPRLTKLNTSADTAGAPVASGNEPETRQEKIAELKDQIAAWNWQLSQLWEQASNINNLDPVVERLERRHQIQETNYENLALSLEQAHINEALATDKAPNIRWVQAPSPPFRQWNKTYQKMAVLAFGGIFLALCWAFLIEFYLDRSVKRPIEVESKLNMPLFLFIPDMRQNGHARLSKSGDRPRLKLTNSGLEEISGEAVALPAKPGNGLELVSLERNKSMNQYFSALRDRLVVYFEVKNLKHNPKLIAVTGVDSGSGVSTIAAGLAASLSETGEGNVLLIDMNMENGAAQQFHKGNPAYNLDTALNGETKNSAQVRDNLYVVSEETDNNKLPRILPKRISDLMPKLRASEYDYIIFDMPPVSQTSVTPRIARFMDMTLMVIESEKTDRDNVQRANKLLVESGATVSAVLNKTRKYVPNKLNQGYLGEK
jgi:polysaccharide biosynthesis transport protein